MSDTRHRSIRFTEKQLEAILLALRSYECDNYTCGNKSHELAVQRVEQALESIRERGGK